MRSFVATGLRWLQRCVPLLLCAFVSAHAQDTVQLPLAPAVREPGEVQGLLREALGAYEKLPSVTRLYWLEGTRLQGWNPALSRFHARCASGEPPCQDLLQAEVDALAQSLPPLGSSATEAAAVTWSALADLCDKLVSFESCTIDGRLLGASMQWLLVSNDALFVAYLERYEQHREEHLTYLRTHGETPNALTLQLLPAVPSWVRARQLEIRGDFAGARSAWMGAIADAQQRKDLVTPREASYHLARLSWRLGDAEAARGWESYLPMLPGYEADVPKRSCMERQEQWRVDIARAAAGEGELLAPTETLRALVAGNCPFSRAVLEYAMDRVLAPDVPMGPVRDLVNEALRACQTCPPSRRRGLATLSTLLAPDTGPRMALAEAQRAELARLPAGPGTANPIEDDRRLAWAVGAQLLGDPATRQVGASVLLALQERVRVAADGERSSSGEAQRNRSRYEPLFRLAAVAAVAQGTTLDLRHMEAMRAQTLLRRLRLEALATELAGVSDPEAEAKYRTSVATVQAAIDKIRALTASDPATAWIANASIRAVEDAKEAFRIDLLESLARRKIDGGDPRQAWLRTLTARSALWEMDLEDHPFGRVDPLASLEPDEAYLSWLKVPGGYIAAVAQFDPAYRPPYLSQRPGGHRRFDLLIPLSAAQEETIVLYRELLLSGAGNTRGARRTGAVSTDEGGLRLRGQPVWRTPEGTYVATERPPANSRRAAGLDELAGELYRWLLQPTQEHWRSARRLVISPDGVLAQVPFETLRSDQGLLLDAIDVSYVQSLEVHAELKRRLRERPVPQRRLLSIAAPDYGNPPASAQVPDAWMTRLRWLPLPGTEREAKDLRALYPSGALLAGREATRAKVLDLNGSGGLQDFSVLHFATHGYVDDERSALVLSTTQGMQQAYLTDRDISGLRLRTNLVLLSACDTGLGRVSTGEGVVGLPYAFMLAGNVDTLMSLWPIDDEGTALFIPAFMAKARSGMDLVAALNATKREFASGAHGPAMRDPRVWATFVQYGVPLRLQ